ncbi:MAG: YggS family pyridoxal phosphate-dependent enzyme [Planctomycetota bacterium]|nr:YggS family pyridoxal phosphate-dependent enzyme [Planctomycetota bacterium]
MAVSRSRIEKNLQRIRKNIQAACDKAQRLPGEVSLVAVTKSVDLQTIKNLLDVGLRDLGESRIQQLTARADELDGYLRRCRATDKPSPDEVRWHMVGHLQRNKVRQALEVACTIHSVDSLRLAEAINARAERAEKIADVLLQVNCSQESKKHGCAVGAAMHLAELICTLKHVRLTGLMTMAPLAKDPAESRTAFLRLRELFEEIRNEKVGGKNFRHLSMGMSQDYAVAVEEGATILRIGTALFE